MILNHPNLSLSPFNPPRLEFISQQFLHNTMESYKTRHTLQQRKAKVSKMKDSDPDKVIMVAEKHPLSKLPSLPRSKFLALRASKCGKIKAQIESKIREAAGGNGRYSFYLYMGGQLVGAEATVGEVYERRKDEDGILYLTYQQQQAF